MSEPMAENVHGSAIRLQTGSVLLLGASGSGKSSLMVHFMENFGGQLIADDRVRLSVKQGVLYADPPPNLAGKLELRGLGVVTLPYVKSAALSLAVNLVARKDVPRIAEEAFFHHQGCALPQLDLHGFDRATPETILHALTLLPQHGFSPSGIYATDTVS